MKTLIDYILYGIDFVFCILFAHRYDVTKTDIGIRVMFRSQENKRHYFYNYKEQEDYFTYTGLEICDNTFMLNETVQVIRSYSQNEIIFSSYSKKRALEILS